jgi:hypothetical protein
MPAVARRSPLLRLSLAGVFVLLALPASPAPPTAGVDRIQVPGGTEAIARLVGYVDPRGDRFAARLNRVLLRRIRKDHDWERVDERRLLSGYVTTVRELRRLFPARTVLTLDGGRLPQAYLDLARFFGFQYRGGEWVVRGTPGEGDEGDLRRRVALALDLNIRSIAYHLLRGESVVVDIPASMVDAPMPFEEWSALTGREVTQRNGLSRLIEDQPFGLLLEGLHSADRDLGGVLGRDGLQAIYRQGSLPFYRYSPSLGFVDGNLVVPGGEPARSFWKKLVGVLPDDAQPFLLKMLRENDTRAAHFWQAMYGADAATSLFLLAEGRQSSAVRKPLLDYIDRIFAAEGAGMLRSGRGGDHSVSTLARSLPLSENKALDAGTTRPWLGLRGLQQACLDESRLLKIGGNTKGRGLTWDRFLEHLLGDATPLSGGLALLFQPFIEIQDLFARHPESLTPANVLLLRRAAAYRPLLLRTLLFLPLDQADVVTDYLLAAEHLDCLPVRQVVGLVGHPPGRGHRLGAPGPAIAVAARNRGGVPRPCRRRPGTRASGSASLGSALRRIGHTVFSRARALVQRAARPRPGGGHDRFSRFAEHRGPRPAGRTRARDG